MQDCARIISTYLPKGCWKSFIFTCKDFYSIHSKDEIYNRSYLFFTLIKKYPNLIYCHEVLKNLDGINNIYVLKSYNENKKKLFDKYIIDYVEIFDYTIIYTDQPREELNVILGVDILSRWETLHKKELNVSKDIVNQICSYHTNEDKKYIFDKQMYDIKSKYKQISKRIIIYFLIDSIDMSFMPQLIDKLIDRYIRHYNRRELYAHQYLSLYIDESFVPYFSKNGIEKLKSFLTKEDFKKNKDLFQFPDLWNEDITYDFVTENDNNIVRKLYTPVDDMFYEKSKRYKLARKYAFDIDGTDLYKYSVESEQRPWIIREEFKLVSAYVGDYAKRHSTKEKLKLIPRDNQLFTARYN